MIFAQKKSHSHCLLLAQPFIEPHMKLLGSTVQDHHVLSRAEGTAHKGEEATTDQRIHSRSNIFGAWFYFFQRDPDRSGVLIINTYNYIIY